MKQIKTIKLIPQKKKILWTQKGTITSTYMKQGKQTDQETCEERKSLLDLALQIG
jgi:hypothetical protein